MPTDASDFIRPLALAENQFLQVLVSRFTLARGAAGGCEIAVAFDRDTPAIWNRRGRQALEQSTPDFPRKANAYQDAIEGFLLRGEGEAPTYVFDDPTFRFRYCGGGALPVVRLGSADYYALFYREISPVGWNLAAGICNSRHELRYPAGMADRELFEELVVVDLGGRRRFVLDAEASARPVSPEQARSLVLWSNRLGVDLSAFDREELPLKWVTGPDTLRVRMADEPEEAVRSIFLNVNATDYGIEINRIVKVNLADGCVLLDGEVAAGRLLDRPVGLFRVDRLNEALASGATEYRPDRCFHGGQAVDAGHFDRAREAFVARCRGDGLLSPEEFQAYQAADQKYNLCPTTRGIILRYLRTVRDEPRDPDAPPNVFISCGGPDWQPAEHVRTALAREGHRPFLYKEEFSETHICEAIDRALESARCLVAVATDPQNLTRPWTKYEIYSFLHDIHSQRKPDGRMLSFISGFDPIDLPRPLRLYQAVPFDPANVDPALGELAKHVGPPA